ncbi:MULTISPECIES: hypothetical protein [unclassified Streptomyces]|uniref:hypothetical protein n=1 Tax=unclassified Streptomyces TaxID=2593676 RepID=UPI0037876567
MAPSVVSDGPVVDGGRVVLVPAPVPVPVLVPAPVLVLVLVLVGGSLGAEDRPTAPWVPMVPTLAGSVVLGDGGSVGSRSDGVGDG